MDCLGSRQKKALFQHFWISDLEFHFRHYISQKWGTRNARESYRNRNFTACIAYIWMFSLSSLIMLVWVKSCGGMKIFTHTQGIRTVPFLWKVSVISVFVLSESVWKRCSLSWIWSKTHLMMIHILQHYKRIWTNFVPSSDRYSFIFSRITWDQA